MSGARKMEKLLMVVFVVSLSGCGGANNAEPADQETLDRNSIQQNIINKEKGE